MNKRIIALIITIIMLLSSCSNNIKEEVKETTTKPTTTEEVTTEKPTEPVTEETKEETTEEITTEAVKETTTIDMREHSELCKQYLQYGNEFEPEIIWNCYLDALKDEQGKMYIYRKINKKVYYKFEDDVQENEKVMVKSVMNEIENIIDIKFLEYDVKAINEEINNEQIDLVYIRCNNTEYTDKTYIGIYSYLGKVQNLGRHEIWIKRDGDTNRTYETIRHEFCHLLGLSHTNSYVSVLTAAYNSSYNSIQYSLIDKLVMQLLYSGAIGESEEEIRNNFNKIYY